MVEGTPLLRVQISFESDDNSKEWMCLAVPITAVRRMACDKHRFVGCFYQAVLIVQAGDHPN